MPGAAVELHEREGIDRGLIEGPGACWASIARRVGRRRVAVAREVQRYGGRRAWAGPGRPGVGPGG